MRFLTEGDLAKEASNYGVAGGRPQVVWPNGALASTAVGILVNLFAPWGRGEQHSTYLEYDGNSHSVARSARLEGVPQNVCHHFSASEVGDPFWKGFM
jgi:hypothetical protein